MDQPSRRVLDAKTPDVFALIGYMEEALPLAEMTRVEEQLRASEVWRAALLELSERVDHGEHSVATIWRRHRLTCPPREQLGAYLIGALDEEEAAYVQFHLDVVGCRWCEANQADLKRESAKVETAPLATRRKRFFESSVGLVKRDRP